MRTFILILTVLVFINCNTENKKNQTEITNDSQTTESKKSINSEKEESPKEVSKEKSKESELYGYYVGQFRTMNYENVYEKKGSYVNKINISIDKIKNDSIFGHSVVAGNYRPFKGVYDSKNNTAKVFEPGDNKYDGVFEFNTMDKEYLNGIWIANNKSLAVPKREYNLEKKEFVYNPNFNIEQDYRRALYDSQDQENGTMEAINGKVIKNLNASIQELTNQDIENLNKGELEVLRNLIYARHGYSFKNRRMRYFFDSKIKWYIPVSTDIRSELTDLEKKNIELIKRYEQHAERYYDYFGR